MTITVAVGAAAVIVCLFLPHGLLDLLGNGFLIAIGKRLVLILLVGPQRLGTKAVRYVLLLVMAIIHGTAED